MEYLEDGPQSEDNSAFVPLVIPSESIPPSDESNALYFRVEVNSNHLASVGGRLSYSLVSQPDLGNLHSSIS